MKAYITFVLLFITGLFSINNGIKNETVDEARTMSILASGSEYEDNTAPTKTIKDEDDNITIYKDELKLSSAKDRFIVDLKNAFDVPNILSIKRADDKILEIVSKKSRFIEFMIKKSDIKVGDKIIINTKGGDKIVELEVVE